MIIDFSLQNFRSVKQAQVLSLLALQTGMHLSQHVAYPAGEQPGVLRSAGIYGANAAGKSNILLAFEALRFIACGSGALKEGQAIPCYEPYQLALANRDAPVRFEIEFVCRDGLRYLYAVAYDRNAILEESLDFYPGRQKAGLFKRAPGDSWEQIRFGSRYTGGVKRIPLFANNSYLSKAGDNAAASSQIRAVFNYLRQSLQTVNIDDSGTASFTSPGMLARAGHFLCSIDTGIAAMQMDVSVASDSALQAVPERARRIMQQAMQDELLFSHATDEGGVALFCESMESNGTRKLMRFLPLLMHAFAEGTTLIIDELERSVHPHIAELVVKLFNDPQVNLNHAQLIFSTHNTSLMSPDLLRPDQIWFTEKRGGATSLFSLADFDKVKNDSPYQAWYGDGRFGALPMIDYAEVANLLRPEPLQAPPPLADGEDDGAASDATPADDSPPETGGPHA